jgi:putative Mn2+ efflux pump MntP
MRRHFEVWFYIGVILGLYGVMLTLAGVYQWIHPPQTVLAGKHATFWAGCLLLLIGGAYTIGFWPKKSKDTLRDDSRQE